MVMKVPGKEIDQISNCAEKVFDCMGHENLVDGVSNLEFLPESHQLKEHCFGLVGHRISDV